MRPFASSRRLQALAPTLLALSAPIAAIFVAARVPKQVTEQVPEPVLIACGGACTVVSTPNPALKTLVMGIVPMVKNTSPLRGAALARFVGVSARSRSRPPPNLRLRGRQDRPDLRPLPAPSPLRPAHYTRLQGAARCVAAHPRRLRIQAGARARLVPIPQPAVVVDAQSIAGCSL